MTRCWVMAIWTFSHSDRTPDIADQISDTGHASDFIFCPMLLCSALDRQIIRKTRKSCEYADSQHCNCSTQLSRNPLLRFVVGIAIVSTQQGYLRLRCTIGSFSATALPLLYTDGDKTNYNDNSNSSLQ